jgi:hypothetical protein
MTTQHQPPLPPPSNLWQETLHDYFTKEEEFLAEYAPFARAASSLVRDDWQPNPNCNDVSRRQRDALLRTGRLLGLTFDAAAVYHNSNGRTSLRIVLQSPKRIVTLRVSLVDGAWVAEKIADRKLLG